MREQIHCGNFRLELTAYTRDYLETGLSLAFAARPAVAYALTNVFGIVFFQYLEREEGMNSHHAHLVNGAVVEEQYRIHRFPYDTYVGECSIMAWEWLESVEYEHMLVGRRDQIWRERRGSHNSPGYSIKKGFRIRTSDDGILGDHHGVICQVFPEYMVCYQ